MAAEIQRASIKTRLLVVLLAAVVIPSVVLAAVLIRSGQRAMLDDAFGEARGLSESIADSIRELLSEANSLMSSVNAAPGFVELDPHIQQQVLQNLTARFPFVTRLAVYDVENRLISASAGRDAWTPPAQLIRQAIRAALAGETYIGGMVHYFDGNRPVILMAVPVSEPGRPPVGAIVGVISLQRVQEFVQDVRLDTEGYVFVVDSAGRVMAHPVNERIIGQSLRRYNIVRRAISGIPDRRYTREDIYVDVTGQRVVGHYRHLAGIGWSVIVQQPAKTVFGVEYRGVFEALLWTLLFALVFAIVGLYLVRRITNPVGVLSSGAEIIGSGDLAHRIDVHTGDELEDLADTLNAMAANLQNSRQQLEQEHDKARRAALEAQTLYSVSQALASRLGLRERLDVIAENVAAICGTNKVAIWLIQGNHLIPYASFGLSPDEEDIFKSWEIHVEEASAITQEALEKKKAIVVQDAAADERVPRNVAERLNMRSLLAVPIVFEDRPTGYAITFETGVRRRFTDYQLNLTQAIAAQAAVAIESAQAYERERWIAETLQRALLPTVPAAVGDFEIADKYASALKEAEIGGDFYDVFQLSPEKLALVIADISGKGLAAGTHTAMVKYTLRAYALEYTDPVELISRLNKVVYASLGDQLFVTLFYGILDIAKKELTYVNAGHELPLLFGEDRHICMRLATTGTALGILESYDFGLDRTEFLPGDVLLFYTDGAVDVRRDRKFLGIEGLEEMFCSIASFDAHRIVDRIDREIRAYANGVLHDDVALMVVKYRRRVPPAERIAGMIGKQE